VRACSFRGAEPMIAGYQPEEARMEKHTSTGAGGAGSGPARTTSGLPDFESSQGCTNFHSHVFQVNVV
jgi:hypothetical protein